MEMHHKLRRDPNWDPRGCNLCGQVRAAAEQQQSSSSDSDDVDAVPYLWTRLPLCMELTLPGHCSLTHTYAQVGHQAVECPNGTVNWKQIYGEEAFILRPPIYESQLRARRQLRTVDEADLRQRADAFAKVGSSGSVCGWVGVGATASRGQRECAHV